jgi:maltose alpha-D-glucosyltransferase/alpha-amylase
LYLDLSCYQLSAIGYQLLIMLTVNDNWERLFDRDTVGALEARLPSALSSARWYGGKARAMAKTRIQETIRLRTDRSSMVMVLVEVGYQDGGRETYAMLFTASFGESAAQLKHAHPQALVTEVAMAGRNGDLHGCLQDALWDHESAEALLQAMRQGRQFQGEKGTLQASFTQAFSQAIFDAASAGSSVMQGEQSNTSVRFGRHVILKLFRRFEAGVNPDLEIGRVLTARGYAYSPAVLGSLEYAGSNQQPGTVAIAQAFIENQGDAWRYTLDELERELTAHLDRTADVKSGYIDSAALLGQRTAELHLALAQDTDDPNFAPEPAGMGYWVFLHDRMTRTIAGACTLLRARFADLPEEHRRTAALVLESEGSLLARVHALVERSPQALRIRCHGDFHLGQVLYTGRDFVIIDFEGEPARPLAERRAKHVPIVDVAGMIRSFHYAAYTALDRMRSRMGSDRDLSALEQRINQWYRTAADGFLSGYAQAAGNAPFVAERGQDRDMLLNAYVIEKACYELSYELNNRPGWVGIPLSGLLQLAQHK